MLAPGRRSGEYSAACACEWLYCTRLETAEALGTGRGACGSNVHSRRLCVLVVDIFASV